mmetsp:Transcript_12126/g.17418  ORF Transcript_12126/g.17418 Transcript_12126/m.17418 type:complete len:133 (-) Transcript_12126:656-1054(-)
MLGNIANKSLPKLVCKGRTVSNYLDEDVFGFSGNNNNSKEGLEFKYIFILLLEIMTMDYGLFVDRAPRSLELKNNLFCTQSSSKRDGRIIVSLRFIKQIVTQYQKEPGWLEFCLWCEGGLEKKNLEQGSKYS